ncbi:MAG: hypothetical protein E7278_09945 [Lachnospiraceae bacterium]|nr:hypothetical protein [Lachnospiraceae bacterium]
MKKTMFTTILAALLSAVLLMGCGKEVTVEKKPTPKPEPQVETTEPEETKEEEPQVETRSLTITFVNECQVDIGMLSVIDPVTGEQAQVDPIPAGESISLDAAWPVDVTKFNWAIYNQAGELYMECETDISVAKTAATITLVGEDEVEELREEYE